MHITRLTRSSSPSLFSPFALGFWSSSFFASWSSCFFFFGSSDGTGIGNDVAGIVDGEGDDGGNNEDNMEEILVKYAQAQDAYA